MPSASSRRRHQQLVEDEQVRQIANLGEPEACETARTSLISYGDSAVLRVRSIAEPDEDPSPDADELLVELADVDPETLLDDLARTQLAEFGDDRWRSKYEQRYSSWGADVGAWLLLFDTALTLADALLLAIVVLERQSGTASEPIARDEAVDIATYRASARWAVDRSHWTVIGEGSDDGDRAWSVSLLNQSDPTSEFEIGMRRAGQHVIQTTRRGVPVATCNEQGRGRRRRLQQCPSIADIPASPPPSVRPVRRS